MPTSRKRKNRGRGKGAQERRRRIAQRNTQIRAEMIRAEGSPRAVDLLYDAGETPMRSFFKEGR